MRDAKVPEPPVGPRSAQHGTSASARRTSIIRPRLVEENLNGIAQDLPASQAASSTALQPNRSPNRTKGIARRDKLEDEGPYTIQTVAGVYQGIAKEVRILKKMVRSVYDAPALRKGTRDDEPRNEVHRHDDNEEVEDDGAPTSEVTLSGRQSARVKPWASLDHVVKDGYSNIDVLLQQLQCEQRYELIAEVDAWIAQKLPQARRLEADLNNKLTTHKNDDEPHAKWNLDDTTVTKHMESFYDKLEETMRSQGQLARDKQRLTDAKVRAKKLKRRGSVEQQKLKEIQDEVKEIRDELIGMDASVDENMSEAREKKRLFDEFSEKVSNMKGDVEFMSRKLVNSKENCRLFKLALEQVNASGDCRVSGELRLDQDACDVVRKIMERLRGGGSDRIRDIRPEIRCVENENATVEASIEVYESKLENLRKEHALTLKKMVAAGIDGADCLLEAEEVYRERADGFKQEIDATSFKRECLEKKLEELENTIDNMNDSARAMEDAQPLFWSNIVQAIRNLLREVEDSTLREGISPLAHSDPREIIDTATRSRRLEATWDAENKQILSIFANVGDSVGSPQAFDHDFQGSVAAQAPLANSLESSCTEIWKRIDRMKEIVQPTGKNRIRSFQALTHSLDRHGNRLKMMNGDFWQLAEKQRLDSVTELAMMRKVQSETRGLADEVKYLSEEYQGILDRQAKSRADQMALQGLRHLQIDSLKDLKDKVPKPSKPRDVLHGGGERWGPNGRNASYEVQQGFGNLKDELIARAKARTQQEETRERIETLPLHPKDLGTKFSALQRGAVMIEPKRDTQPTRGGAFNIE